MRINLTRRSSKSELIDGIVFPSGLSSRCRETDTPDSAHAPTKLCTNYSTHFCMSLIDLCNAG